MFELLQPRPGIDYIDPVRFIEQFSQRSIGEIKDTIHRSLSRERYQAYDKVLLGQVLQLALETGRYTEDTEAPRYTPDKKFRKRLDKWNVPKEQVPFYCWVKAVFGVGVDQTKAYLNVGTLPAAIVMGRVLTMKVLLALFQAHPNIQDHAAQLGDQHGEKRVTLLRAVIETANHKLRTCSVKQVCLYMTGVMEGTEALSGPGGNKKKKRKGRPKPNPATLTPDERLDRVEASLDPIAVEVDMMMLQLRAGDRPTPKRLTEVRRKVRALGRKLTTLGPGDRAIPREQEADPAEAGQQLHPAGAGQDVHPARAGQDVHPAGAGQDVHPAGAGQDVHPAGAGQDVHPAGAGQEEDEFTADEEDEGPVAVDPDPPPDPEGDDEGGEGNGGGEGGGGGESGGGGENGEDDEEVPEPAKPPTRRARHEEHLPVGYPGDDYQLTGAERSICSLIVAISGANSLVQPLLGEWQYFNPINPHLQLHFVRELLPFEQTRDQVLHKIARVAGMGTAELSAWVQQHGGAIEDHFPLIVDPQGQCDLPMTFLTLEIIDPLDLPDPTPAERKLIRVLSFMRAGHRCMLRCLQSDEVVAHALACQLKQVLEDSEGWLGMLATNFDSGSKQAQKQEEEQAGERAHIEMLARKADENMVVLGADSRPKQWHKIGKTANGTHVAVTQSTGWLFIAVGPPGKGKTHGGVLNAESMHLDLPGINCIEQPGCSITISSDWRRGQSNHQHLCGLEPNPYPQHWKVLRDEYRLRTAAHNAAFDHMIGLVLPGQKGKFEQMYPEDCERGLEIRESRLNPEEWGSFSYSIMLPGANAGGKVRSQWRSFIDAVIANHGPDASPELILKELTRAKLPGLNIPAMQQHFKLIGRLTSKDEWLRDVVKERVPVVMFLEDPYLSEEILLPLEVAKINALSRPFPGEPRKLFIMHEHGKQGDNELVGHFFKEKGGEIRHGQNSFYIETHLFGDLWSGVVSMATGIAHYAGTCPADYKKGQGLFSPFAQVSFEEIEELPDGAAKVGWRKATNGLFTRVAQTVYFRPSCIWAGGETELTNDEEDDEEE